jgi:hypothetical protein
MASVLTVASEVGCGHRPGRVATSGVARLTVEGSAVLVRSGVSGKSVAGCSTPTASNPPSERCTTVTSVTRGEAARLFVDGVPVLLDTLAGGTNGVVGSPANALSASAGQSKLEAQ